MGLCDSLINLIGISVLETLIRESLHLKFASNNRYVNMYCSCTSVIKSYLEYFIMNSFLMNNIYVLNKEEIQENINKEKAYKEKIEKEKKKLEKEKEKREKEEEEETNISKESSVDTGWYIFSIFDSSGSKKD